MPSFGEEEEDSASDDDAAGFIASIADDWEDHIYDARIAAHNAAVAHKLQAAKKKNKNKETAPGGALVVGNDGAATDAAKSEYVRTEYGTEVLRSTWESLHQYQRDGCRWLHGLYDEGVGGILGDEMGM